MNLLNDKRGFLDTEVLTSVGFVILFGLAFTATILGYIMGKKWGLDSLSLWQIAVIIVGEFVASYFFVTRDTCYEL